MPPLTIYLAKLFGLYFIVIALIMMAKMVFDKQGTTATVNSFMRNAPLTLFSDVVTVIVGLALVIGHNVWSGGALQIVVTILGWLTLIGGVVYLAISHDRRLQFYEAIQWEKNIFVVMGITLVVGLYLTVSAFSA
jgi:hypothetical protein